MLQYGCLRKSQTGLKKNHIKTVPRPMARATIAIRLRSSSTCSSNGIRASGPYWWRRERSALIREPRSAGVGTRRRARRGGRRWAWHRLFGDRVAGHRLRQRRVGLARVECGRVVAAQALGLGLEDAQGPAERAGSARKLGRAEQHENDDSDDQDLGPTEVGHRVHLLVRRQDLPS